MTIPVSEKEGKRMMGHTHIIFPRTCLLSTAATARRRCPPSASFPVASGVDTDKLRTQLDQLHTEADSTRTRANNARMRLMRLSEAAKNLQRRAASNVLVGKEHEAREMLIQRKKLMQALEKSKNRIEVLDELSTKINEAISLKEAQLIENIAMIPEFSKEDSYHQIRFISPKDDFPEDSDKTDVSDSDCTKSYAKEEQVVESCDTNQAANVLQPNIEELVNIVASNDSNGFSSLKNISSYTDFLRYVDGQLKEVETDLVDFLRLSTLILENKHKHMNTKVWQTSELLKDICSIRERISSFIDESEAQRYRD